MKIAFASDTHNQLNRVIKKGEVPDADVLIIAGDFTNRGRPEEIFEFRNALMKCPHQYKIVIAGNHDISFEDEPAEALKILNPKPEEGFYYLQDSGCEIEGVKFWGSPWQPWFCDWAFNIRTEVELKTKWDLIPDDTDVLITHGPPAGILDQCPDGRCVGSTSLLDAVMNRVKPKVHTFGHIHHSYGSIKSIRTRFVNACVCNEQYSPFNPIQVFDV